MNIFHNDDLLKHLKGNTFEKSAFHLLQDDYTYNDRFFMILYEPWLKGCLTQLITVPILGNGPQSV